ncbi:transglycosylase family protein [Streptomyces coelicoflavus]|uniref:LysM peptidoglycan-binding domain-containing protein n=1 Tax=Streptomyces coelicoflavus TaxID=285562 RepID=A0A6N9UTT3_9ACTN|nr:MULTISPECIES: transglycosylase family protein [Streptomyces]NEB21064.1 LysM peptidoglycan-binding domain-containing protein [Streptomyces coelicoflavus]OWA10745.1 peptigoglycan-binding protein LysM [Streptomyces sp. CS159]
MLSGNGRHRRPRQAPALVVAAGVTGSAIAIPLLGATGAHAADGANWDRVAECETGGAWSQNSGNGYYGGLQLSQEVWEQYGGLDYAPSADQASRSQQIRIAEKIHADQGIAAWPTCGLLAGLGNGPGVSSGGSDASGDGASEGTDASGETDGSGASESPTNTEKPESSQSPESSEPSQPSGTTDSADASESASGAPSSSPSPTSSPSSGTPSEASPDDAASSTKSDTPTESDLGAGAEQRDAEGSSGSGRHRGDSADEGAADRSRADDATGRHASRDGEPREVEDGSYTVRSGDNLWAIADSLEVDGGWRALYAGNKAVVGADPDHILPGQTLTVTGESGEK